MDSLKIKTAKNLSIVYGANIISTLFGIVVITILARLLTPQDFGLVALSAIVLGIILLFQDFGLGAAVVQRKDNIDEAVNVAFYGTVFIKFILYLIVFITAPLFADFFNEPILSAIIRISALALIIDAFSAGHDALILKNLEFEKRMSIQVVCSIIAGIISVILALRGFSFWSLVYGSLAVSPIRVILYWFMSPWRPKLSFDTKVASEMFGFGGYIMIINMLGYGMMNIDNLFIGKFLNAASLGIYNIAKKFGLIGAMNIPVVINQVMFPTFSTIQGQIDKLQSAYFKTLKIVVLLITPMSLGTVAIAPEFVTFILGEKWIDAILPLQIIAIYGIFYSIGIPASSVFLAVGKPKLPFKITLVTLIFIIIMIYPFGLWRGIIGVALCVTLSRVIGAFLILTVICPIINLKYKYVLSAIGKPFIASLMMLLAIMLIKSFVPSSLYALILFITAGIITYFIALFFIDKESINEFKDIFYTLKKR